MKKSFLTFLCAFVLTFVTTEGNTASAQNIEQTVKGISKDVKDIVDIFKGKGKKKNTTTTSATDNRGGNVTVYQEETSRELPMKIESVHPDLKVRVTRCVAAQKTVMVTMEITDIADQDDRLEFSPWWCSAIDDAGNEHKARLYSQGEEQRFYNLVSGVKKKVEIRINDVPTSVESIARIVLPIDGSSVFPKGKIIIRNIPIDRDE